MLAHQTVSHSRLLLKAHWLLFILCLTMVSGCSDRSNSSSAREAPGPVFVATIKPVALILKELCGDTAEVRTLLPPAASPHTFEPSPSDLRMINGATLFISVAPNLDGWAAGLGEADAVEMITFVPRDKLLFTDHHHHHDHGDHHDHSRADPANPHFWLDPVLVDDLLPGLKAALCEAAPEDCETFTKNAEAFSKRLRDLDEKTRLALAPVADSKVITFHPSFDYLFASYGIEVAAVLEATPGSEPSPKYLHEIVKLVESAGVRGIFSEPQLPARSAEAVAEAAGAQLYMIDPLGMEATSYEELIDQNTARILEALR